MKIPFKQRSTNLYLLMGILWMVVFVSNIWTKEKWRWLDVGFMMISLAYFGCYLYQKRYHYVSIDNGMVVVSGPLGKKMHVTEIQRIKKFAGEYILKSDQRELRINTQLIPSEAVTDLETELEKLGLTWG